MIIRMICRMIHIFVFINLAYSCCLFWQHCCGCECGCGSYPCRG